MYDELDKYPRLVMFISWSLVMAAFITLDTIYEYAQALSLSGF